MQIYGKFKGFPSNTLSPIIMVQWKTTPNKRKLILEIHPFSTVWEKGLVVIFMTCVRSVFFFFFGPSVTGKTFRIGSVGLVYYVYTYI